MVKSKAISYILTLSLVVMTVIGIVIGVYNKVGEQKLQNETTIELGEQKQTEMKIDLTGIHPGDSTSYKINLNANKGDAYISSITFEKTGTDSLAPFIDVEIKIGDERIDGARLSDYLGGRRAEFTADFSDTDSLQVEIIYSMSVDIGDEAQNTTADFKTVLNVER